MTIESSTITVYDAAHPEGFALDETYLPAGTVTAVAAGSAIYNLSSSTYLMLGDNRPFSYDSRSWGLLPAKNMVGLVRIRLWPLNEIGLFTEPKYQ